ncbi:hypothetical protein Ga0061079_1274, partial [Apibacter mensalis]
YQYTYQNPLKYTDPTGMKGEGVDPNNPTEIPEIVVTGQRIPRQDVATLQQIEKERRSRAAYKHYTDAFGGKPLMHTQDVKNWTLGAMGVIFGPFAVFEGIAAGFFSLSGVGSTTAVLGRAGTDAAVQTAANLTTNGGDIAKAIGDVNLTQSGLAGFGMNYVGNALLSATTVITMDRQVSIFNGTLNGDKFLSQAALGVIGGAAATGISGSRFFKGTVIGTYMQTSVRFGQTTGSKAATVLMNAPDYGVNVIQNKLD